MPAEEARRRHLGGIRGLLIAVPLCAAAWTPLLALLISRAT